MREELQQETSREPALTTADLARVDETASQRKDSNRDLNDHNLDLNRDDNFDRQTNRSAELERARVSEAAESNAIRDERNMPAKNAEFNPSSQQGSTPLFSTDEAGQLRDKWQAVQVGFVDEPRSAVQQADGLVASAIKRHAEIFANERTRLDREWDRGGDVSTEELRVALQRYRSFFDRLLSV